jgi:peptidoglycan/LPS O-acetylase OafA/YrhL
MGAPDTIRNARRNARLDALRGIAVLLVLGRHYLITPVWKQIGWSGVDVFFVLSGFLISGLIFREYQIEGRIHLARFWTRRALRVYPPFLVMLGSTLAIRTWVGPPFTVKQVFAELTWTQNYAPGLWVHTWSLAVEEHFYFLLPLLLAILMARYAGPDPFRSIPAIASFGAVAALAIRSAETALIPFAVRRNMYHTEVRIDSLLFGVLLAYLYWFHRKKLLSPVEENRKRIGIGCALLVAPIFVFPVEHWLIHSAGFTLLYLASGGVMLLLLTHGGPLSPFMSTLAGIGKCSYSIYLWHLAVLNWSSRLIHCLPAPDSYSVMASLTYVGGSLFAGWLMYVIVERPAIRLRDRFFPPKERVMPIEAATAFAEARNRVVTG